MARPAPAHLSKRERQIMDVLYRHAPATAAEVRQHMADAPSYSAVRTMLGILERKGHVRHLRDGLRYVYSPSVPRERAQRSALKHLLDTFFDGSAARGMAALFDLGAADLDDAELSRLRRLIDEARKKGRK
jgi:BlaI family transcriptional regulator, penicillinase repressor